MMEGVGHGKQPELRREDLAKVVFSDNEDTRELFRKAFKDKIEKFIDCAFQAYQCFTQMESKVPKDTRSAWVQMFLFSAFNNLITSFHLLISGFAVPAGNLMRQYAESIAMALLCSHSEIDTFKRFEPCPEKFPVHKALVIAGQKKNKRILSLDHGGWAEFQKISQWYNHYSHGSVMTHANQLVFNSGGTLVIGGQFDPAKLEEYGKEVCLRISACDVLVNTIKQIEQRLATPPGSNVQCEHAENQEKH